MAKKRKIHQNTLFDDILEDANEKIYLWGEINRYRKYGYPHNPLDNPLNTELPEYIVYNMKNEIRDYQINAIQNFIFYEEYLNKNEQTHLLFHMATGSGKTYIMGCIMLYYYKKGYRNFVFFVNNNPIIEKTKINFLEKNNEKYLFSENIIIDGKPLEINEINTFDESNDDCINVLFTSISKLTNDIEKPKEGCIYEEDFKKHKVIFLADEAHHLNAKTSKEKRINATWEATINKLLKHNKDSKLFEFTATCKLDDDKIKAKYKDKIIFNYRLQEFRNDKYTKDYYNYQSNDLDDIEKIICAMIFSYYREELFASYNILVKPAILVKSRKKEENKILFDDFVNYMNFGINEHVIKKILNRDGITRKIDEYLFNNDISYEKLISQLKIRFSINHLQRIDGNNVNLEIIECANKLDEYSNPLRVIFVVDMLNEGWDVTNLFDIVRCYTTGTKSHTIKEAQLIGRGVRYCKFNFKDINGIPLAAHLRKFDNDESNPMKICETLYFHSTDESKYIAQLRDELKNIGLDEKKYSYSYELKESFIASPFYKLGSIYANGRVSRNKLLNNSIPDNFISNVTEVDLRTYSEEISLFSDKLDSNKYSNINEGIRKEIRICDFAKDNYNILYKIAREFSEFKFDKLKENFPKLSSLKEFICCEKYLGKFKLDVITDVNPNNLDYYRGFKKIFEKVHCELQKSKKTYYGTDLFVPYKVQDYIKPVTRYLSQIKKNGVGVSQRNQYLPNDLYLDLSKKTWFVYTDHFGTEEEKYFIKFFDRKFSKIKEKYEEVYLIRNEGAITVYCFDDGLPFQPDFILILKKYNGQYMQEQIFIEPKGKHLIENENSKSKDKFLKELRRRYEINNTDYDEYNGDELTILGFPLYEHEHETDFSDAFSTYFNLK